MSFLAAAEIARDYDTSRWAGIGCPVTALTGDRDVFVRDSDLQLLRSAIPHAVTRIVEDCGHFANVERPNVVAAAITR